MKINRQYALQSLSCRSRYKRSRSNPLKKNTFRNLSMSGCNSPNFKKSIFLKRKGTNSQLLLETESQDQCEYVIFPVSTPPNHNEACESLNASACTVKSMTRKSNSHLEKDLPKITDKHTDDKKLQDEVKILEQSGDADKDDAVTFVKEIKKSSPRLLTDCTSSFMEEAYSPYESSKIMTNKRQISTDQIIICADEDDIYDCTHNDENHTRHTLHDASSEDDHMPDELHLEDNVIDLSNEKLEDDDDLVIVSSNDEVKGNISRRTLRRVVQCIVFHFLEESNARELNMEYVLGRLHRLYQCDFYDRIPEIETSIKRAFCSGTSQLLQSSKEVRPGVRHGDIDTLSMQNWVNDVIINRYMAMLVSCGTGFAALSSFWFEELLKGKEPVLPKGWEKMDSILAPVCVSSHWSLLAYVPSRDSVQIFSSLPVTEDEVECGRKLLGFIAKKLNRPHKEKPPFQVKNLPRQANENDCGVYVCMFARCIVCGNSFQIAPEQVTEFRQWLKNEIIKGRLLTSHQESYE